MEIGPVLEYVVCLFTLKHKNTYSKMKGGWRTMSSFSYNSCSYCQHTSNGKGHSRCWFPKDSGLGHESPVLEFWQFY